MPSVVGVPRHHLDLIAHILRVGGGRFSPAPLLCPLAIDGALIALGVAAFRRRDPRC
jgi:ABC-2 type transport system permease protein